MAIATIRLKEYENQASTTEKSIIHYILNNPAETINLSIQTLASKTYTSPSSIIRLCKKLGYSGYKEFIKELIYEQALRENYSGSSLSELNKDDKIKDTLKKVTYENIISLEGTEKLLDEQILGDCVDKIRRCHKLVLIGMGASLLVAKDAHLKFTRVGKTVLVSDDWHTQLLYAKNVTESDVVLVVSYSGQTNEVIDCLKEAKSNGATVISITKNASSIVSKLSDYNIYIYSDEFSLRSAAMSSRIAQLNVIDILYLGYVNAIYDESIERLERTQIKKE